MKPIAYARDKITDPKVLDTYDKYKRYLSELAIYEEYIQDYRLDKINKFKLKMLYKKSGLEKKKGKELEYDFRRFSSIIGALKQKYPGLDLKDISTQRGRTAVSDAIYKTQNEFNLKTADLEAIAIVENFFLCATVGLVNEGKENKTRAIAKFDITEAEFNRAQESFKKYEKSGMIEEFNRRCMRVNKEGKLQSPPDVIVHYVAGTLEITPAEAIEGLFMLNVLKREDYNLPKNLKIKDVPVDDSNKFLEDLGHKFENDEKVQARLKTIEDRNSERIKNKQAMVDKQNQIQEKNGGDTRYRLKREDDREVG